MNEADQKLIDKAIDLMIDNVDVHQANAWHVKVNRARDKFYDDYGSSSVYNVIQKASCHGPAAAYPDPDNYFAVVAPIKIQARQKYKVNEDDLQQYYAEVMPFFSEVMLKEYDPEDEYIIVDPDAPGNYAIMALIVSRQPWEGPYALETYIRARNEGLHPIVALQVMQYLKKSHCPMKAYGDHDVFTCDASPRRIKSFIDHGFNPEHARPSFNERNKQGVHAAFDGSGGTKIAKFIKGIGASPRGELIGCSYLGRNLKYAPDHRDEMFKLMHETYK